MSRTENFIGLPQAARDFLEENCRQVVTKSCPRCNEPVDWGADMKGYDKATACWGDDFQLFEYTLKDGSKVREDISGTYWSGGPNHFTKLVDSDGNVLFDWSEQEMERYL